MPRNSFMMHSETGSKYQTAGVHFSRCHPLPQMHLNILLKHKNGFIGKFSIPKRRIHKVTAALHTAKHKTENIKENGASVIFSTSQNKGRHIVQSMVHLFTQRGDNRQGRRGSQSLGFTVHLITNGSWHQQNERFLHAWKLKVLFNLSALRCFDKNVFFLQIIRQVIAAQQQVIFIKQQPTTGRV